MKVLQFLFAIALWCIIAFAFVWNFKKTSDPPAHEPGIFRALDASALAISEPSQCDD